MLSFFDWFGTAVFALSGTLAAGQKKLDVFGSVVVAFVTAVGGGTLRDVLLGLTPVFWVRRPAYVAVCAGIALVTFALMQRVRVPPKLLLVCDAIGLGVFTVLGCQVTLQVSQAFPIVILMGAMSGVAGGAIRDVLCGDVPTILRTEIYATAALAGGAVFFGLWRFGAAESLCLLVGSATTIAVQLIGLQQKASLPVAVLKPKSRDSNFPPT